MKGLACLSYDTDSSVKVREGQLNVQRGVILKRVRTYKRARFHSFLPDGVCAQFETLISTLMDISLGNNPPILQYEKYECECHFTFFFMSDYIILAFILCPGF